MSRRDVAGAAVVGALAVAGLASAAEAKPAAGVMAPILALVKAHNAAFNKQDLPAVMATFSQKAIMMGTAHGEVWEGWDAIEDAYRHFILEFDPGTLKFEHTWWDGALKGDYAWFLTVNKVTHSKNGKSNTFGMNLSVTCGKENGKWVFHNMHFSSLHGGQA